MSHHEHTVSLGVAVTVLGSSLCDPMYAYMCIHFCCLSLQAQITTHYQVQNIGPSEVNEGYKTFETSVKGTKHVADWHRS